MALKKAAARAACALSTWGLRNLAHRPAANLPGKIAWRIDPNIIAESRDRITEGSIMVVGTNGKTTVTNLIADVLERADKSVLCNRTGANLAYGVTSTLLQGSGPVQWGVFECDELWSAKVTPQIKPTYFVLLNLFRDQLDRCGEIDHIQDAIVAGLKASPDTTLIYNADDPLCAAIAERLPNAHIAFGTAEDMGLAQNQVADAQMCHRCSGMFTYEYRQYGQLGAYTCPKCGFTRPTLDAYASGIRLGASVDFTATMAGDTCAIEGGQGGPYLVYNLLAVWTVARKVGVDDSVIQQAIKAFDPQNGRLQTLTIASRKVLLNLAKNPTGFNQNLKIITADTRKKVVAFFINDNVADGHDISWIWDCDFEELTNTEVVVFAGGTRANDLQVRLKYAGVKAQVIEDVDEMIAYALTTPDDWSIYAMANYTALPAVRKNLMQLANGQGVNSLSASSKAAIAESSATPADAAAGTSKANTTTYLNSKPAFLSDDQYAQLVDRPLTIVHAYPDLLNLYGDGGNVRILAQRCAWRGVPVEVAAVHYGEDLDLSCADILFLGGGPDLEQRLASQGIHAKKDELEYYVNDGGVLLAICGGYQILGSTWLMGNEEVEGLGLVDARTVRAGSDLDRLIDNVVLDSPLASIPVVGYENHAGRTVLGPSAAPFGRVINAQGHGNDDTSKADGVLVNNIIGTYLHGPLLSKNPEIADLLIVRALERRFGKAVHLSELEDKEEKQANAYMLKRLGVHGA